MPTPLADEERRVLLRQAIAQGRTRKVRFLHTADWHVGRHLDGSSLLNDQAASVLSRKYRRLLAYMREHATVEDAYSLALSEHA